MLEGLFAEAESAFHKKRTPAVEPSIDQAADKLFASNTLSYREVLVGCGLVRLLDRSINIRHPYVKKFDDGFNGRSLDEDVVNPFLQSKRIPCTKGPYLAVFRRSVELTHETVSGLRDKDGYEAMMHYMKALEDTEEARLRVLVVHLLYRLLEIRESAEIPLARIRRLSLEQFDTLIRRLLQVPSGGLIPVLLVVAMLRAIKACFKLSWKIEFQGINVSDKAARVGGDITVMEDTKVLLAIEVTERPIGAARIVSTFQTKIVEAGIKDYIFVYSSERPDDNARQAARRYFPLGHEISFLGIEGWLVNNLGTLGGECRALFTNEVLALFSNPQIPATIKVAWNESVERLVPRD